MSYNLEERKQRMFSELDAIEEDIKILKERIPKYREDILKVQSKEEAVEFDKTHDLEKGLKAIQLF